MNFEELKKRQFSNYLTASDETTIDEHITNMAKPSIWGTQVELLATTSFFQVPLYFCQSLKYIHMAHAWPNQ